MIRLGLAFGFVGVIVLALTDGRVGVRRGFLAEEVTLAHRIKDWLSPGPIEERDGKYHEPILSAFVRFGWWIGWGLLAAGFALQYIASE